MHCPKAVPLLGRAALVLACAVAAGLVWSMVSSLAEAFAAVVFGACAAMLGALVWVLRYGGLHRPARRAAHIPVVRPVNIRAALPAARTAIEAAPPRVVEGAIIRPGERMNG